MSKALRETLIAVAWAIGFFLFLMFVLINSAIARDNGQWAQADPARREWFKRQEVPQAAREKFGIKFKSCCDQADVFKTRFRVGVDRSDQWEYVDTDGEWKIIPPEIISEEPSLDNKPLLFKVGGKPVCFFKPQGGI